jgi:hypothetical protein
LSAKRSGIPARRIAGRVAKNKGTLRTQCNGSFHDSPSKVYPPEKISGQEKAEIFRGGEKNERVLLSQDSKRPMS